MTEPGWEAVLVSLELDHGWERGAMDASEEYDEEEDDE